MVGEMIEGILPPFSYPFRLVPRLSFSLFSHASFSPYSESSFSLFSFVSVAWSFVSVFVVSFFLFFYTDLSPYSEVGSFGEILLGVYSYVLFFLIL
jgi:hypothetical protein